MEKLKLFWCIYDKYIKTGDTSLRSQLSVLLSQIEEKDRKKQLLRPEKDWNKILAWQVLRHQSFIFSSRPLIVSEGEIIVWLPHWDRDVFITRIPREEFVSGAFLKPGFKMDSDDRGDLSDYDWERKVLQYGLTDERGLYLPLYNYEVVIQLCNQYFITAQQSMIDYIHKEIIL